MITDYGVWGVYNDQLAGPPPDDFVKYIESLHMPPARILEFGVGSGRLALPLARAGYQVSGIDSSAEMLRLLASNDPLGQVVQVLGDFTTVVEAGVYEIVLLAYNALSMQTDRESQRACIRNATAALAPGGYLVIENTTPRAILTQLNSRNQAFGVQFVDGNVWLYLGRYFPAKQRYLARYIAFDDGSVIERNADLSLIDPEEIRRLATDAGLEVARVSGDWSGSQFNSSSDEVILTLCKPEAGTQ